MLGQNDTSPLGLGWYYLKKGLQACASRAMQSRFERAHQWATERRGEPDTAVIESQISALPVRRADYQVNVENYPRWVKAAHYPRLAYLANRDEKFLEHQVSVDLLNVKAPGLLVDVASCRSQFPNIMRRRGFRVIAQDLSYPLGLHGDILGGDAAAMDLPEGSIDGVTLHCSFEHFEGDADTRFATNIGRLLKPGGRVVILPLYLHDRYVIETDPLISGGDVPVDRGATLAASFGYTNRFGRHYDAQALLSRVIQPAVEAALDVTIVRISGAKAVSPGCYLRYALLLERPG
jgi:SAM-dependent methyltransferase